MEIERNPVPPEFTNRAKELITELCFRQDNSLKRVDGIFVFASIVSIDKLSGLLDQVLSQNLSNKIFLTGGVTPKKLAKDLNIEPAKTEADTLLNALYLDRYKDLEVFVERKSTNTLENVTETLKFPEFRHCKSLVYVFKSHAAGRGYLTLRKFFPKAEILQQTFDAKYEKASNEIRRDNWHTFDFGRSRVWGEYLRIKEYGSRGDIEFDEVSELLKKIEVEVKKKQLLE